MFETRRPVHKPQSNSRQKRYLEFMRSGIKNDEVLSNPMATYEWFVSEWKSPLNPDGLRQAWLAAWALSIDAGKVNL